MKAADERTPEEAARWASDPSRVMPGEDPETLLVSDAARWVRLYHHLIQVKDDLLAVAIESLERLPPPGAEEIRGSDLVILRAERVRFVTRLEFWKARQRELEEGALLTPPPP